MKFNNLVILLVCALLLAGCQGGAKKVDDAKQIKRAKLHYQIGLDALHKNQMPKAFEELMLSDKLNPNQPKVLDLLAHAWRLRGDFNKSESYYIRAIQYGGGPASLNNYGNLLIKLGRYSEAETRLRKALEDPRYPNQFMAHMNLGDALLGLKKFDDAIDSYRQAKALNPRQSLSRIKEAEAYVASGRLNYAHALYETMLRENPKNRAVVEGLVKILILQKKFSTARTQLSKFREASVSELDRAWAADELDRLNRL
ncbi:MAG: tetratricopeptide repeat protein [Mariprofundaceae bacterium]